MPGAFGRGLSLAVMGPGLLLGGGTLLGNRLYRLAGSCVGFGLGADHELLLRVSPLTTHPEHFPLGRCPFASLVLAICLFELRHLGVGFGSLAGGPLCVVLSLVRKRRQTNADGAVDFAALFLLGDDGRRLIVISAFRRTGRMAIRSRLLSDRGSQRFRRDGWIDLVLTERLRSVLLTGHMLSLQASPEMVTLLLDRCGVGRSLERKLGERPRLQLQATTRWHRCANLYIAPCWRGGEAGRGGPLPRRAGARG